MLSMFVITHVLSIIHTPVCYIEFYQFPVKIILVGLCLKALNSIEKLHRIE